MPRILPSYFWNPIYFTQTSSLIVRFSLVIDNFFRNPYKPALELRQQDKCYITQETSCNHPFFECIAKITLLALFFFYKPKEALLLTGALLFAKCLFRYAHPIEQRSPIIPAQPLNPNEGQKEDIIRWVQKQVCSDYFFLFALGISETAFNFQTRGEGPTEQIEIHIGEEFKDFPRNFLEKIPFFNALLRANMRDIWKGEHERKVLRLSAQNTFSLSTLEKLQRFDEGQADSHPDGDDPSRESLDFLGVEFTLRVMRKFGSLQEFQKSIFGLNGNRAISELGIDLQSFHIPQVKVPCHDCKNIPFDNTDLEEEICRLEENLSSSHRLSPRLSQVAVEQYCEQQRKDVFGFLERIHSGAHSQSTLYLATNRLVESYLDHLRTMSRSFQLNLTQEFLQLFNQDYSWHKHVTILTLPSEFNHMYLVKVTEKLPQLHWLSVSFFRHVPGNPLDWIFSWIEKCPQLRVLALSGLGYDENVYKRVMEKMKQLEIFEIER